MKATIAPNSITFDTMAITIYFRIIIGRFLPMMTKRDMMLLQMGTRLQNLKRGLMLISWGKLPWKERKRRLWRYYLLALSTQQQPSQKRRNRWEESKVRFWLEYAKLNSWDWKMGYVPPTTALLSFKKQMEWKCSKISVLENPKWNHRNFRFGFLKWYFEFSDIRNIH